MANTFFALPQRGKGGKRQRWPKWQVASYLWVKRLNRKSWKGTEKAEKEKSMVRHIIKLNKLKLYCTLKISKSACTTTVRTINLISSLGSSYEIQCWSFVVEEYLPRLGLLFRHHQYLKNWIMEWEFKTRLLGLLFLPPYYLSFSYSDGVAIAVGSGIGGTEAASSKSGGRKRWQVTWRFTDGLRSLDFPWYHKPFVVIWKSFLRLPFQL